MILCILKLKLKLNLKFLKLMIGKNLWLILIKNVLLRLGGVRIKNVKIQLKIDLKMKPLRSKVKLYYLDQLKPYVCHMIKNSLLVMRSASIVEIKLRSKSYGVDPIDIKIIILIIF